MAQANANKDLDLRRAARHRADHAVIGESKKHGDQQLHIINVSAHGFMIDNNEVFERGDRIELRLPAVGRIEAYLIWSVDERAGFQFERVIRLPDFLALLEEISPRLRKA
ncbi:MAG: PilZ domain-containing protein [Sphingorhabdus sp.]